jgi:hypothetical protein
MTQVKTIGLRSSDEACLLCGRIYPWVSDWRLMERRMHGERLGFFPHDHCICTAEESKQRREASREP